MLCKTLRPPTGHLRPALKTFQVLLNLEALLLFLFLLTPLAQGQDAMIPGATPFTPTEGSDLHSISTMNYGLTVNAHRWSFHNKAISRLLSQFNIRAQASAE
jgi:hypothetical protein